ncbi:hypothetical protein [Streptomyces sp. SUK 48]|uniref:hypothetical protein n=1 Tax=unclassified Streptomyces TaxID=2593676 RepID=UPI00189184A5|nr:hypothetical protein [Streptomyces sp. SUK 48]
MDVGTTDRPRVVADFHRVSFMDLSGIDILISAHRALILPGTGFDEDLGPVRSSGPPFP